MESTSLRLVWLVMGAATAWGTATSPPLYGPFSDAPPCVMLATLEQDLGTVGQGEALLAMFPIQNVGGERLFVRKDSGPFLGSSATAEPVVLEPGEVRVLHVFAETSQSSGKTVFQADYTTNAPARPRFSLRIRTTVRKPPPERELLATWSETAEVRTSPRPRT